MGGEKDLSASIKLAFLVEEMACPLEKVFKGSPSPFAYIAYDFALPNFWKCCKNTSIIEESSANAEFAFKIFE